MSGLLHDPGTHAAKNEEEKPVTAVGVKNNWNSGSGGNFDNLQSRPERTGLAGESDLHYMRRQPTAIQAH